MLCHHANGWRSKFARLTPNVANTLDADVRPLFCHCVGFVSGRRVIPLYRIPASLTLGDGGEVFFLGLIDTVGFASATLESFDPLQEGLFEFNVDDIVTASAIIPEPGTMALFGLGVLGMAVARRRANLASA